MRRSTSLLYSLRSPSRGVTLIELLVGLTIMVILATLSVPSFIRQINSGRIASAASELQSSLTMARSQAIQTGKPVSLCRSNASGNCITTAGNGWEQGWIVFLDTNGDGKLDAGETIVNRVAAMASQLKVSGNTNVANMVTFRPSGSAVAGTISVCSTSSALKDTERALKLVLISNGRIVQTASQHAVPDSCPALGADD